MLAARTGEVSQKCQLAAKDSCARVRGARNSRNSWPADSNAGYIYKWPIGEAPRESSELFRARARLRAYEGCKRRTDGRVCVCVY